MKIKILTIALLFVAGMAVAQEDNKSDKMTPGMTEKWDPEISKVTPGKTPIDAPSDAIVLFDGIDLENEWTNEEGGKPGWLVEDGCVTVVKRAGTIKTKRVFEDYQLHIEWRAPAEVIGESQGRGNSGIFMQERYEVQVLDNYNNRTYRNGQAGSLYKQHPPLVNACKGPGEWQTYDIIYTAPRFNDNGTYFTPPIITVLHNGVLVQNNVKLRGPTVYVGVPEYEVEKHGPGSIVLQDHGNPVSYKNIWIREL
ncbi:MAG: DUF1080 domain-containing protein [Bacteroidetes bacterium]|nr:DUF1080 domain-containing protein [Bacteroidota bacterium]